MIDRWGWLAYATDAERAEFGGYVAHRAGGGWVDDWNATARDEQRPPPGDWRVWLVMAGRGFGKTRTGAEWVRAMAEARPEARIAIVAASLVEARAVMIEGESGVIACSPPDQRPKFEPSLRRIVWPNGAQAALFSAAEPESLRGPQHSHARGTVAKRVHRQRSPAARRSRLALRGRGRACSAAAHPARGSGLAGGSKSNGCIRGIHLVDSGLHRGGLAVHRRAARYACVRSIQRMFSPLYRCLAALRCAAGPRGRHHDRSGSANSDC